MLISDSIYNQLILQVHYLNKLNTLMLLKIQVQIHNMGAFGCKYVRSILIINVCYEHILISSLT